MKSAGRLLLILSLSVTTGCSTVKGWFSDDDFDPREPVELQKIDEQVKVNKAWSRGVGNGQGDGLYKINPLLANGNIYSASAEG